MKRNAIRTTAWTGLATLLIQQTASFFWGNSGPPDSAANVSLLFPLLWVFFIFFHFFVLWLSKAQPRQFTIYYLGLLGMKMFFAMITVLIYGYLLPEGLRVFVSILLPLYAVLTGIEVMETLNFLRWKEEGNYGSEG